jgi:DNA polymerase-3 subunit delta'
MVEAGSHPDLHLVYKELAQYHEKREVRDSVMQELGIPVIRQFLIAPAWRSSSRGRGKVFIVLEAELLSTAAQNALLKTLEEPPPKTTIILICQRQEELLPTTRSRCSIVRFHLLPQNFVEKRLVASDTPEVEARFWAAFTGGSIGQALELHARGLYEVKTDIVKRLAELASSAGAMPGELLARIMEKLADQEVSAVSKAEGGTLSKNLASRKAAGVMLQLIGSAFHDALVLKTAAALPLIHVDQRAEVEALAARFDADTLARIIEQLSEFEELLWRNLNPKIVWDNVAITCGSGAPLNVSEV